MKRVARILIGPAIFAALLAITTDAAAQGRVVARPAPRHVVYASARPYAYYRPYYRAYYAPYYYSPGFGVGYGGWYGGFGLGIGFGWSGWPGAYGYPYPYAYGPYPYGYPYGYRYDYSGAARLEVKPREAEVFVDGHIVGLVDDFDGWAQRLYVDPGEHELAIYLKGHRTFRENVLLRPGATLKIEHVMQPLGAGEADEPRPVPAATARRGAVRRDSREPQDEAPQDYPHQPGAPVPAPRRGAPEPATGRSDQYGSLAVRVQPLDAEVLVDGESWQSPDAGSITLQLSEGVHRIELRKEGYRTYSAEVRVRRGDSTSVNVSLTRQ